MNNINLLLLGVTGAVLIYFMTDRTEKTAKQVRKIKKIQIEDKDVKYQQSIQPSSRDTARELGELEKEIKKADFIVSEQDLKHQEKMQDQKDGEITNPIQPIYEDIEVICTNRYGCNISGKMKNK